MKYQRIRTRNRFLLQPNASLPRESNSECTLKDLSNDI